MKTNEDKINEVLDAFSGIKRAPAPDHFESVLMSRLQFVRRSVKWLQFSAAALVLFALLNLLTAMSVTYTDSNTWANDPMEMNLFEEQPYTTINFESE